MNGFGEQGRGGVRLRFALWRHVVAPGSGVFPGSPRFAIGLLGACLVTGLVACSGGDESGEAGYLFESVDVGAVRSEVSATGTLNPLTAVQVGTYVSGPIREIDVDFNSAVRRGQRVAKIDPAPFQVKVRKAEASRAAAEARVRKDRADLRVKKLNLERTERLAGQALVAQQEVDSARGDYDQAEAQLGLDRAALAQATAELEEARINLAYTDITSPVDGIVVSRNVDVGQTVAATFQTPTLFLIAEDLTKMQIDTSVSESDIGGIRVGQEARFGVDAYPGRSFAGVVTQIRNAPTTVQNVVTYDVVVGVDNPTLELKPGMTANVSIVLAQRPQATRVPLRALRFRPEDRPASPVASEDEATVWVRRAHGGIEPVVVRPGIRDDERAEILAGEVRPGDEVAVGLRRREKTAKPQSIPGIPRFR